MGAIDRRTKRTKQNLKYNYLLVNKLLVSRTQNGQEVILSMYVNHTDQNDPH